MLGENITLSLAQLNQLQSQILVLGDKNYALEGENSKKQKEYLNLKERLSKREEELTILKEMVATSSTQQDELLSLRKENQGLLRSLTQVNQQHQVQIEEAQARIKTEQKGRIESKRVLTQVQTQLKTSQDLVQQQQHKIADLSRTVNKYDEMQLKVHSLEDQLKIFLENETKLQSKTRSLEARKQENKKTILSLKSEKDEICGKYTQISAKYTELTGKHDDVTGKYLQISAKFTTLSNQLEEEKSRYSELTVKYDDVLNRSNTTVDTTTSSSATEEEGSAKQQSDDSNAPSVNEHLENNVPPSPRIPPSTIPQSPQYVLVRTDAQNSSNNDGDESTPENENPHDNEKRKERTSELVENVQSSEIPTDNLKSQQQLHDLQAKLDSLKNEHSALTNKHKTYLKSSEEKTRKLETDLKSKEEKNSKLEVELKAKEDEIVRLDKELKQQQEEGDKVIGKFSHVMLSNDKARDEIKSLENKLSETQDPLRKQQEKIDSLDAKSKLLEKEVSGLRESVQQLTSEKNSALEINQMQVSQIEAFKNSIMQVTQDSTSSETARKELIHKHNNLRRLVGEKEKQIDSLQMELSELKSIKSDMEILQSQHTLLMEKYGKVTEKNDIFSAQLHEETQIRTNWEKDKTELNEKIGNLNEEIGLYKDHIKTLESQVDQRNESLKTLNQQIQDLNNEVSKIPQLTVELSEIKSQISLKDETIQSTKKHIQEQEMSHRVEQRQNVTLIKQLQNQLKMQGVNPSAIFGRSASTSPTIVGSPSLSGPSGLTHTLSSTINKPQIERQGSVTRSPGRGRGRGEGGRGAAAAGGNGAAGGGVTKDDEGNAVLENDVLVMGLKLGMLQQENFDLEQENQSLRTEVKMLREESEKKSKVISKQIRGIKNPENDFWTNYKKGSQTSGDPIAFVGSLLGRNDTGSLQQEVNTRMGAVIEETLMQNIQLQDDVINIATELEKLSTENKELRRKLNEKPKNK